jgi:ubiquinone/menaquinone biosynthesis C-methylase UbiE
MSAHSEQNERVIEQFAQQANAYAALVARSKDTTLPEVLDVLRPTSRDRLLDVGCGSGDAAVALAPLVAHVTGVDLTLAMLEKARQRQAQSGRNNIDWRKADVTALPFGDRSFDIVTSRAMLHHVHEPAAVIAEMKRVCVSAGRMLVIDMTPAPEKAAALNAIELLRDPSHARAMVPAELRQVGVDLGLEEIAFRQYAHRIPVEHVLSTSHPGSGILTRIRELYHMDAAYCADALGLSLRWDADVLTASSPMSMVAWRVRA